jgi:uncharacterized LabA/DUF88 family protein
MDAREGRLVRVVVYVDGFNLYYGIKAKCGRKNLWLDFEEKETDVSIATALIEDAVLDRYDTALLISADSDLCPAVAAAKRLCPDKRIVGVFPPGRHSTVLQRTVDGCSYVAVNKIRQSQLPDSIDAGAGVVLRRPREWT